MEQTGERRNLLKYCIVTYGCQMNAHESEKLSGILEAEGYERAVGTEDADLVVFNTCCIRENAERKAEGNIGALKKWKRANPSRQIAVVGCMTQQEGFAERLAQKFPFVDVMLGTHNAYDLVPMLERARREGKVFEIVESGCTREDVPARRDSGVSALVNIMYGCDNFCTYCIVPYVRGRERSRAPESIRAEVAGLLEKGYREITLLGQNVNSYRGVRENGQSVDFSELLAELAELPYRYRLRFMTSHPKDFSEKLVRTVASHDNIAKCIHLPVQAGSSEILRRMNRRYSREDYLEKIACVRRLIPDCAITTDLMVGFPGETEEDFEQTMRLCREVKFSSAFTFVYSRRSGTKAAEYPDQVPEDVKKSRIMRLVALQNQITAEGAKAFLGKTCDVLCEGTDDGGVGYFGRTEGGRLVLFSGAEEGVGKFLKIKITHAGAMSLRGDKV